MVVACYREVELDRKHPFAVSLVEWNRERLAVRINLNRLSQPDVQRLLEFLFDQVDISEEFAQAIYRETEGNPFFIEEVIKSLIEQGQIYRQDGRWQRNELADLAIPQSVKEAIGRRLDRQSETCLEVLHTAAALGKRFAFPELATAVSIDENELLDALDEANHAQLVRLEGQEIFIFTHDKIREVLYEELNPIRRRRLHLRIGEGLERLYGGGNPEAIEDFEQACDCEVQTLAHHFIEAGELLKGLRYSMQAARKAISVFALEEAVRDYQWAIECAQAIESKQDLADIYEALGGLQFNRGSFQASIEASEHALEYASNDVQRAHIRMNIGEACAQTGDELGRRHLEIALQELDRADDPLARARLYALLGRYYHLHAEWEEAASHLERARMLAEPLDDARVLTEVYAYLSGAYQQWGRMQDSMDWAQKCIDLGERKNMPFASALGCEFMAEDLAAIDRWHEALDYAGRDWQIGEKIGSLSRMAWAKASFANIYRRIGQLRKSLQASNEALEIISRSGEQRLAALVHWFRASALAEMGDYEGAWADVALIDQRAEISSHGQVALWASSAKIEVYFSEGKWDEVIRAVDEAEAKWGMGYRYLTQRLCACVLADRRAEVLEQVSKGFIKQLQANAENSLFSYYVIALTKEYLGDLQAAVEFCELAVKGFETRGGLLGLAYSKFLRSRLRLKLGETDAAVQDAEQAEILARECKSSPLAVQIALFKKVLEAN